MIKFQQKTEEDCIRDEIMRQDREICRAQRRLDQLVDEIHTLHESRLFWINNLRDNCGVTYT